MTFGIITPKTDAAAPFRRGIRKVAGVYVALVFVVSAFLAGLYYGSKQSPQGGIYGSASGTVEIINTGSNKASKKLDFNQFWDLWSIAKERYVHQPVDEQKMFYGAMAGMVAALGDPYSVFFEPKVAQQFTQELSGKFEGIGAEIGIKQGNLVIISPLPGSPAEKAGLKPGDRIVAIDDIDTSGLTIDEATQRIRGDKGTKVRLYILRSGFGKPKLFEVTRDTIVVPSVETSRAATRGGKRLAILKVTHFNGDTADKFRDAVSKVALDRPDGVILDLRNNPGGFLDAAISMLGEWIPGNLAVSERYSDGSKDDHAAVGDGRLKGIKTVVLVNGGSASASEIMAGALQDNGAATLIGTQTFGKGSVQDLIDLKDGASVKLTIAEWLTPKGKNINENGIAPDYVVELTDQDFEADRDPQLDAAKKFFDGVTPPKPASATSTPAVK